MAGALRRSSSTRPACWPARVRTPISYLVYADSVSGMSAADLLVSATADNIANMQSTGYRRWQVNMTAQPGGGVNATAVKGQAGEDLVDDMTGLMTGALLYKANARAISVGAQTEQSLFNALA
jgi:Flagella basal body rod protein